jgi:hypothetical protein
MNIYDHRDYPYVHNKFTEVERVVVSGEFENRSLRGVLDTTSLSMTCDRSVVFSTNKTHHHDITEILLKVVLNTITLTS